MICANRENLIGALAGLSPVANGVTDFAPWGPPPSLIDNSETVMIRLLTQRQAANLLCLSERTLERLRLQGGGPLYVKAGRAVRYRETDLEAWIAARVVSNTSQIGDMS